MTFSEVGAALEGDDPFGAGRAKTEEEEAPFRRGTTTMPHCCDHHKAALGRIRMQFFAKPYYNTRKGPFFLQACTQLWENEWLLSTGNSRRTSFFLEAALTFTPFSSLSVSLFVISLCVPRAEMTLKTTQHVGRCRRKRTEVATSGATAREKKAVPFYDHLSHLSAFTLIAMGSSSPRDSRALLEGGEIP